MAAAIAEAAPHGAPAKGGKKKLFVIVGAVLALVLAAGGGGVVYLKKKQAAEAAAAEEEGEAPAAHAAAAKHPGTPPAWLPLDPFVVNLADRDADRYAQIGITLELDNPASADQIRAYMPAVRNAILLVLAGKTSKDLLDRSGKETLAEEIAREAARPLGIDIPAPKKVKEAASDSAPGTAAKADDEESPKPKKKRAGPRNPIQAVNFSSFIVQ